MATSEVEDTNATTVAVEQTANSQSKPGDTAPKVDSKDDNMGNTSSAGAGDNDVEMKEASIDKEHVDGVSKKPTTNSDQLKSTEGQKSKGGNESCADKETVKQPKDETKATKEASQDNLSSDKVVTQNASDSGDGSSHEVSSKPSSLAATGDNSQKEKTLESKNSQGLEQQSIIKETSTVHLRKEDQEDSDSTELHTTRATEPTNVSPSKPSEKKLIEKDSDIVSTTGNVLKKTAHEIPKNESTSIKKDPVPVPTAIPAPQTKNTTLEVTKRESVDPKPGQKDSEAPLKIKKRPRRCIDPILEAQNDILEQRVTREVIGRLQETGSLEANDLVDMCESLGCTHNVMVRIIRLLVATPLVEELPLLGDSLRGDRKFLFRHGVGLGRRVDLATLSSRIEHLEKEIEQTQERTKRIKQLEKSQDLSEEKLQEILSGQPDTVKELPVYKHLIENLQRQT